MPLTEGTVLIESVFGSTTTTVIPGPIDIVSVGAQGPAGPPGPPGPSGGALSAIASIDLETLGNAVVVLDSGELALADPTNVAHATLLLGVNVTTGLATTSVDYITEGEIIGLSGLSRGSLYFLGLNGTLSTSPEAAGATWLRALGNANSATSFVLDKQFPVLLP